MTDAYLQVSHHVQHQRVDGDVICFDGEKIHLLSGSSAEIWGLIDGSRATAHVVEELHRRHPEVADLDAQTADFVRFLIDRGLVVTSGTPSREWRPAAHVAWVTDGPLITVLDLRSGRRQVLSETASFMWDGVVGGGSQRELAVLLRDTYLDAPDDLEDLVSGWVTDMCERGLLEPARSVTT